MPTTFLNLTDLDNIIRGLEKAWETSSVEMLKEESVRTRIPEDILLQWETYLRQRIHLRDLHEQLRTDYLSHVTHSSEARKAPTPSDQIELAA